MTKIFVGGILAGTISGLLFGFIMTNFAIWTAPGIDAAFKQLLEPGEELVFHTPANHKKGVEAVGGKLFLTNKRLIFASHKINIQNHSTILNRHEIISVEKYNHTFGIVKNGLKIKKQIGEENFIVAKVDEWINHLAFAGPIEMLNKDVLDK
ncbi:MAG TPA: GRAM domain-containing protein [Flavobacteriales bacterium]|nr:GRAM domain-containing protein [Flavobacteriales bacterium]